MKRAMSAAGVGKEDIDYISAHGTANLANDRTECAAIKDVFGEAYRNIPVSSMELILRQYDGSRVVA